MLFVTPSRSSPRHPTGGFALVIALSLMAFILLLLISLSSLLRVETQSAQISLSTLKARQNALLGAMIAVGELQKYAGPDQRVTATADLLQPYIDADADLIPERLPAHAWTGVWMNDTNGDGVVTGTDDFRDTAPRLMTWLVSGNAGDPIGVPTYDPVDPLKNADFTDNGTLNGNNVWLVNRAVDPDQDPTNPQNSEDKIQVPKVEILGNDGSPIGEYAYWVSDEGVKTYAGKGLPVDTPTQDWDELNNLIGVQALNPDKFAAFEDLGPNPAFDFPASATEREKLISLSDVEVSNTFLEPVMPDVFHDLTLQSSAVLADVRDGGLKKDLSIGLQAASILPFGDAPIFPPQGGGPAADDPGGSEWAVLRSWYNTTLSSGQLGLSIPSDSNHGFLPVVRSAEIRPFFTAVIDPSTPALPAGATSYNGQDVVLNFRTWIYPVVVLWNPYDVDMVVPDLYLKFSHVFAEFSSLDNFKLSDHASRGLDWKVSVGKEGDIPIGLGNNLSSLNLPNLLFPYIDAFGSSSNYPYLVFRLQGVTIPAGETILYAPSSNAILNQPGSGMNDLAPYQSVNEFGFYLNLPGSYEIAGSENVIYDNVISIPSDGNRRLSFGFIKPNGGTIWDTDTSFHALYNSWELSTNETFDPDEIVWRLNFTPSRAFWHENSGRSRVYIFDDFVSGSELLGRMTTDSKINYNDNIFRFPVMPETLHLNVTRNHNVRNEGFPDSVPHLPWLGQYNPRAARVGASPIDAAHLQGESMEDTDAQNYFGEFYRGPANYGGATDSPNVIYPTGSSSSRWRYRDPSLTGQGDIIYSLIGLDALASGGAPRANVFQAPDSGIRPIISVGQLSHVDLSRPARYSDGSDSSNEREFLYAGNRFLYGNYAPAFAIGNSLADPRIAGSAVFRDWNSSFSASGYHYDYSYLLNEALWDRYFFSTIPPVGQPIPSSLTNSAIEYSDLVALSQGQSGFEGNAGELEWKGAFNVNSTSVNAWRALLSAFLGVDVPLGHPASGVAATKSPILHQDTPSGAEFIAGGGAKTEAAYQGFRALDSDEINALAAEIVRAIKRRRGLSGKAGPFESLANFINRDLNPAAIAASDVLISQRQGVLHEALNPESRDPNGLDFSVSGEGVNSDFIDVNGNNEGIYVQASSLPANSTPLFDSDFAIGHPAAMGVPGYLTQADLLARIGNVLTARSDTFKVRAYGSSLDSFTGQIISGAWCELIVRRVVQPVVPSIGNVNEPEDPNFMGRSFEILSMRWLNESKI